MPFINPTQFNNPWLHWRMTALVTPPGSLPTYEIPGFFVGSAGNNQVGDRWRIHFTAPTQTGTYSFRIVFEAGPLINISDTAVPAAGSPTIVQEWSRNVVVIGAESTAPGFLADGPILPFQEPGYLGTRYLRHSSGKIFVKGGIGSPENFLAYSGFTDYGGSQASVDGIGSAAGVNGYIHSYVPHLGDWSLSNGDPQWIANGSSQQGRQIIGALNYLSGAGVNSMYMLLMNLGGDGRDVHPFIGTPRSAADSSGDNPVAANTAGDVRRSYSVKRMREWDTVFAHAMRKGIMLQFFLAETETDNINWLGAGSDSTERRLFQKNMIAMFGHHQGIKWNLCEENSAENVSGLSPQFTVAELTDMAHWIQRWDIADYDPQRSQWIGHPIAVHGYPNAQLETLYAQIVDQVTDTNWWLDCTSMQLHGGELKSGCSGNVVGTETSYSDYTQSVQAIFTAGSTTGGSSGRFVVMDVDEQGSNHNGVGDELPGAASICSTATSEDRRKRVLFDVLLSGGNVDWYFGYYPNGSATTAGDRNFGGGDLRVENFRTRSNILAMTKAARGFVERFPVATMEAADSLLTGGLQGPFGYPEVYTDQDLVYFIYYSTLTAGSGTVPGNIAVSALAATGTYNFVGRWFSAATMAPLGTAQAFQFPQGGGSHTPDTSSLPLVVPATDYFYLILRV